MPIALLFSLLLALGFFNGLRTLTPVAVLCWGVHLHWFSLAHTPFAFLASHISLWVFTLLAFAELVADKLPMTPARTRAAGFIGRTVFGAGCAAAMATVAGAPLALGLVAGLVGGVVGMYTGYFARRGLTTQAGLPDFPIALLEDAIAIGGAFFIVSRF